jgi:ubiquinone/menaquinone biosynthesis C-methylase UbiE
MQEKAWENEYRNSKLLTKANEPQSDVVRFVKYLRKKHDMDINGLFMLDLGSGTGRNAYYFAELGARVLGIEISATAVRIAKERAAAAGLDKLIEYRKQDMAAMIPCKDASVDIILDITSSNSLDEKSRSAYLKECFRVLKPGGFFFLKTLCKDGDQNAKNLLKMSPGKERDMYYMKELDLYERVFTREDLTKLYTEAGFTILELEKKTSYSSLNDRSYKRNFWICYMKK